MSAPIINPSIKRGVGKDKMLKTSLRSVVCRHTREAITQKEGVHIGVYQPNPALKRTLVAMSERTGLSISLVTDEVLYPGLVGM